MSLSWLIVAEGHTQTPETAIASFHASCVSDGAYYDAPQSCIDAASVIAETQSSGELAVQATLYIGLSNFMLSHYRAAAESLEYVEPLLQGRDRALANNHLYLIHLYNGEFAEALRKMRQNLTITASEEYWASYALTCTDVASLAMLIGDYEKAEKYANTAIDVIEERSLYEEPMYPYALRLVGAVDHVIGDQQMALTRLNKSLNVMQERGYPDLAELLTTRARVYASLQRYDEALADIERAIESATASSDDIEVASALGLKSTVLRELGRTEEALDQAQQALRVAEKLKQSDFTNSLFLRQYDVYAGLARISKDLGNFKDSATFYDMAYNGAMEMFSEKKAQVVAVAEVETDMVIERQQTQLLRQEAKLQELNLREQQLLLSLAVIGLILLACVALALQQGNRAKKAALKSKETFLKEIHHRVKNNLQLVTSLLRLDADQKVERQGNPANDYRYKDTAARVLAMAALHDHLYKRDDARDVALDEYISDLVSDLANAYGEHAVQVELSVGPVRMDIDHAIPIGLIICELYTNAMKYAFDGQSNPSIQISVNEPDDQRLVIEVADNGNGQLEASQASGGSGLKLVRLLAEQLDAHISVSSLAEQGTTWRMSLLH